MRIIFSPRAAIENHIEHGEQKHSVSEEVFFDNSEKYYRALLCISREEVEPTKEFEEAVRNALVSQDPNEELREISKEFGPFWCKKVSLGGKIEFKTNSHSTLKELQISRQSGAGIKISKPPITVGAQKTKQQQNTDADTQAQKTKTREVYGGDKSRDTLSDDGKAGNIRFLLFGCLILRDKVS
jgi:hypothetical protein